MSKLLKTGQRIFSAHSYFYGIYSDDFQIAESLHDDKVVSPVMYCPAAAQA